MSKDILEKSEYLDDIYKKLNQLSDSVDDEDLRFELDKLIDEFFIKRVKPARERASELPDEHARDVDEWRSDYYNSVM